MGSVGGRSNPVAICILSLHDVERIDILAEERWAADLGGESEVLGISSIVVHAGPAWVVRPSDHFAVGREIGVSECITHINNFLVIGVLFIVDSVDGELTVMGDSSAG